MISVGDEFLFENPRYHPRFEAKEPPHYGFNGANRQLLHTKISLRSALKGPFGQLYLPHSHHRRLSVKKGIDLLILIIGFTYYNTLFSFCQGLCKILCHVNIFIDNLSRLC